MTPICFHRAAEKPYGFFCQWYLASFTDPSSGLTFNCAEQFYMWRKAVHFGDHHLAREIQKELDPKKQKAMGRCVSGFTDEEWDKVKTQACEDASMLKYTQCSIRADDPKMPGAPMRQLLLDTGERELIEASPFDRIWGVGRKAEDVRREAGGDRKGWGQNLLGKCLMATRAKLRAMDEREERERLRKVKEGLGLS